MRPTRRTVTALLGLVLVVGAGAQLGRSAQDGLDGAGAVAAVAAEAVPAAAGTAVEEPSAEDAVRPGFARSLALDPDGAPPTEASAREGRTPAAVVVPRIGVDTSLVQLGIAADGSLEVPGRADFDRAGWLTTSALPGDAGAAVIAGHVDSRSGPAVFYRLHELVPGDEVQVVAADGTTTSYTVDEVRRVGKDDFPTAEVYGPQPGPVLRLITCGGAFDRATGHYTDNVIAFASAV